MVTHLLDCSGKDKLKMFYWNWDGKKYRIGNVCLFIENKDFSYRYLVDDIQMAGRKQHLNPMWQKPMKMVDLEEPTSFLDHVYLGCTQRECKSNESIIEENKKDVRITNLCW